MIYGLAFPNVKRSFFVSVLSILDAPVNPLFLHPREGENLLAGSRPPFPLLRLSLPPDGLAPKFHSLAVTQSNKGERKEGSSKQLGGKDLPRLLLHWLGGPSFSIQRRRRRRRWRWWQEKGRRREVLGKTFFVREGFPFLRPSFFSHEEQTERILRFYKTAQF